METTDLMAEQRVPRLLYKYRTLAGECKAHARSLIVDQQMYFAGPEDLNDPFECKPYLAVLSNSHQQKQYAKRIANRLAPTASRGERRRILRNITADQPKFILDMKRSTMETLKRMGIYSLTTQPLDLLMWPHYADNHRGICVQFSMAGLTEEGITPFPVVYQERRPVCDTMIEPPEEWLDKAVLSKADAWKYEREWRIVQSLGARTVTVPMRPIVNGVLLGANISPDDKKDVLSWVRSSDRDIAVAQVRFHEQEYRLLYDEIAV